jgi:phosphatidylserine decarboxylase
LLFAPANGRIVEVADLDDCNECDYLDGPAVRIAIVPSLFDAHVNRSPAGGVVESVHHRPGRNRAARSAGASDVNEATTIGLRDTDAGRLIVRQVVGVLARRIVCDVSEGDRLSRGQVVGRIRFGGRVELIVRRSAGLLVEAKVGQRVRAGVDVLARITEVLAT